MIGMARLRHVALIALTVAAPVLLVAPRLASARAATSGDPQCVLCDSCNGSSGNHVTAVGGGRDGVAHPCFTGSTCNVHDFNSSCGGSEQNNDGIEARELSWQAVAEMNGEALQRFLSSQPQRWRLRSDLRTIQWSDCFGNLVASIPLSSSQVAVAVAAAERRAAD